MNIKNLSKQSLVALGLIASLQSIPVASAKSGFRGEYRQGEILSFGSSLTKVEELELREYFGVASDMEAIYVDNATTIEQLGLAPNALDNYTGGWYSSAHVKLTNKGGVQVTSKNVNLVTNEMFANALITSGILNCEVNVSAPFMVTGESALAGILAGAEEIMGESLSEENKVVAKEEIDTTLDIADEILNDTNNEINNSGDSSTIASGIINDIKQQVIKDSPNSTQIQEIIINVTNNYGVELSEESQAQVLSLMEDVNDLDIDYKDIKDTMENIGDKITDSLKEAGIKLKESGILERIGDAIAKAFETVWEWIKDLFSAIFSGTEDATTDVEVNTETEQLTTELEEEIVTDSVTDSSTEDVIAEDELIDTDSTIEESTEEVVVEEEQNQEADVITDSSVTETTPESSDEVADQSSDENHAVDTEE